MWHCLLNLIGGLCQSIVPASISNKLITMIIILALEGPSKIPIHNWTLLKKELQQHINNKMQVRTV